MIFKRRDKRDLWTAAKDLLAPRKGWRRGFVYIGKRVQRLPDTPHRIALGFACGALASFTPFFTLHLFVAGLLAYAVRANVIAAAFGTIVGNPISFWLIAAISMQLGNWITGSIGGEDKLADLTFTYVINHPFEFLSSIFWPYLIGGLGPGVLCGAAFYYGLRPLVARFQNRRRQTLTDRARQLVSQRRGPGRFAVEGAANDASRRSSSEKSWPEKKAS